jgi:hypothetical protein
MRRLWLALVLLAPSITLPAVCLCERRQMLSTAQAGAADGPTKEMLTAQLTTIQATMALQDANFERGKLLMENAQLKYHTLQEQEKDLKDQLADLDKAHTDEAQPAAPAPGGQ